MRITISHVYSSKNKGDAAILLCQLRELTRVFPDAQIEIQTLSRSSEEQSFDGFRVQQSLMSSVVGGGAPRLIRPLLGVAMVLSTTAWALIKRRFGVALPLPGSWLRPLSVLAESDAQICVGGGYLRGKDEPHSTYLLALLVHQIALGYLLGKPVYLYAQSFGPFPGRGQMSLFRFACKFVSLALPRESISSGVALQAVGDAQRVMQVIDSAFLIPRPAPASLQALFPQGKPPIVLGITARQWLATSGQSLYEAQLTAFIQSVIDRGWGVVVIPQVTASEHGDDDREVGRRLKRRLKASTNFVCVEDELPLPELIGLYGALDYLVGTRFHSVIFALCQAVPFIAIEYEHKTSGILTDLGLGRWSIPIESVTVKRLNEALDQLVAEQETVKIAVQRAATQATALAKKGADLIAQHYAAVSGNADAHA